MRDVFPKDSRNIITIIIKVSIISTMKASMSDAIHKEREKFGKHFIPSADDICATALFKGLVQMFR